MLGEPEGMGLIDLREMKMTLRWKKIKMMKRTMMDNVGQNSTKRVWPNDRARPWALVRRGVQ
jgi:hypothetical protein